MTQGSDLTTILLAGLLLGAPATVSAGERPQDIAARTFDAYLAAWDRADPHAIAQAFATDGDFINPTGVYARGPAQVEAFYRMAFAQGYAGSVGRFTPKAVRGLTQDVIAVDGVWSIDGAHGPDGAARAPERGLATAVLVHREGAWRIALLREQSNAQAVEIPPGR